MDGETQQADSRLTLWEMLKKAGTAWVDDYAPSMGAALAYYTMFSLAPLLLLVIAVAVLVSGADAARGQIVSQISGLIGEEGAVAIQGLLKSASNPTQSLIASIVSLITLIIGATTVFGELQSDLDRIWRAPAATQSTGLWGLLRTRLLTLGLVVSIGFLLLVSLVLGAVLSAVGGWWGSWFGQWAIVLQVVNQLVSFGIITVLFALMYRILPRVHVAWPDVWTGSAATAALFTAGKFLIGLYLGKSGVSSGFGAAGSIVVLLVWVYYSSQIFLLGAEFTWVYAHHKGSRAKDPGAATSAAVPAEPAKPAIPTKSETGEDPKMDAAPPQSSPPVARAPLGVGDYVAAAAVSLGFGAFRWYLSRQHTAEPPAAASDRDRKSGPGNGAKPGGAG